MRAITLHSLILLLFISLSSVSLWFLLPSIILSISYALSFRGGALLDSKWVFGFVLLRGAKRVHSEHIGRFWVLIMREPKEYEYLSYLLEDKIFYCKPIGSRFGFNTNLEEMKSKIKSRLDTHCIDATKEFEYRNRVEGNFKNWDGCLTKADSRDKKIKDIC